MRVRERERKRKTWGLPLRLLFTAAYINNISGGVSCEKGNKLKSKNSMLEHTTKAKARKEFFKVV